MTTTSPAALEAEATLDRIYADADQLAADLVATLAVLPREKHAEAIRLALRKVLVGERVGK